MTSDERIAVLEHRVQKIEDRMKELENNLASVASTFKVLLPMMQSIEAEGKAIAEELKREGQ